MQLKDLVVFQIHLFSKLLLNWIEQKSYSVFWAVLEIAAFFQSTLNLITFWPFSKNDIILLIEPDFF